MNRDLCLSRSQSSYSSTEKKNFLHFYLHLMLIHYDCEYSP